MQVWRRLSSRAGRSGVGRLAAYDPVTDESRRAFFDEARRLTPYLAVEADGMLFIVSTRDRLGRSVFVRRERQDMLVLEHALRLVAEHGVDPAGSTFVDVGANLGTTTVTAVKRRGFARAVALEPEPANFRVLRMNLVANGIDADVTALQAAAADRSGEALLRISTRSSGTHTLLGPDRDVAAEAIAVRAVTLDELVTDGTIAPDEVGLLWLDAPGAEARVLAGASALLGRGVPVVAAVRPDQSIWPEARRELLSCLAGYTHFASLRPLGELVAGDLGLVLDSFGRAGDILAFRA